MLEQHVLSALDARERCARRRSSRRSRPCAAARRRAARPGRRAAPSPRATSSADRARRRGLPPRPGRCRARAREQPDRRAHCDISSPGPRSRGASAAEAQNTDAPPPNARPRRPRRPLPTSRRRRSRGGRARCCRAAGIHRREASSRPSASTYGRPLDAGVVGERTAGRGASPGRPPGAFVRRYPPRAHERVPDEARQRDGAAGHQTCRAAAAKGALGVPAPATSTFAPSGVFPTTSTRVRRRRTTERAGRPEPGNPSRPACGRLARP